MMFRWGSSSAGRAVRSQRTGRRFEPALLQGIDNRMQRAKWGVSGALNPEPALPGLNPRLRPATFKRAPFGSVDRAGLAKRQAAQPRQDREVAAVSGFSV